MYNACEEIKRNRMKLQVWYKDFKKMVYMPFPPLNIIYDYNNGMNDVDLAYQGWNVYKWGFSCVTGIGGSWLWCGI